MVRYWNHRLDGTIQRQNSNLNTALRMRDRFQNHGSSPVPTSWALTCFRRICSVSMISFNFVERIVNVIKCVNNPISYVMDFLLGENNKRQSYTMSFKKRTIRHSDAYGNRSAARMFGIDESMVRRWKLKRSVIFKCEVKRRAFRGPKQGRYPQLEDELAAFVRDTRTNGLCVTATLIRKKAHEIARRTGIALVAFKASRSWVDRFMRHQGFSLRRRTSICQKLPLAFEQKLIEFQRYVIDLRTRNHFLLSQIGNADETPIWFDMPRDYTINDVGTKRVNLPILLDLLLKKFTPLWQTSKIFYLCFIGDYQDNWER